MAHGIVLRWGLLVGLVISVVSGVWALFWPVHFYDTFPLPGHPWQAFHPAYNEHLVRDFGALNLVMALLFGVAAYTLDVLMTRTALVGYLIFAVPHLIFHLNHLRGLATVDAVGEVVSLSLGVLGPVVLLLLTRQSKPDSATSSQ
jgi:hypothetical protein